MKTTLKLLPTFALALTAVLAPALAGATPPSAKERPTEAFREKHGEIREHLDHLTGMLSRLPGSAPEEQRKLMRRVAGFLDQHIRAHAEAEEKALYPVVDRYASGESRFRATETMRHEHGIIGRAIGELGAMAAADGADVATFARKGHELLGVIRAHFDKEEQVLLPVLDAHMTKEQFAREVEGPMGAHH